MPVEGSRMDDTDPVPDGESELALAESEGLREGTGTVPYLIDNVVAFAEMDGLADGSPEIETAVPRVTTIELETTAVGKG